MSENELTSSLLEYMTQKLIFQFIFRGPSLLNDLSLQKEPTVEILQINREIQQ